MIKRIAFVCLILLGLFLIPIIIGRVELAKFQNEIDRVSDQTGTSPVSVDCRNVEFAQVCYAEYDTLDLKESKQILLKSGYNLVDEKNNGNTTISATNKKANIRVDSEPRFNHQDGLILKFKDINVTH